MEENKVSVVKATEKLVIDVETTLNRLRSQRTTWQNHQAQSDTMLYVLLEGCLDFYYFLRGNESYESAFKSLCHFKWNTKTKTTMMIAKAVFGDTSKTTNAYARALERAVEVRVGKDDEPSMLAWLQSNGGVNGVIRRQASGISKASLERENRIEIGKNYYRYGIKCKFKFVNEAVVKALGAGDRLLLVNIDTNTRELEVLWSTEKDALIDEMYSQLGEAVMKTEKYTKFRAKVATEISHELAEAQDAVSTELRRIADKVCVPQPA